MSSLARRWLLVVALAAADPAWAQLQPHREDDGNRDEWQRPAAVMDALGISAGTRVADIGAGAGYFTFHLAGRVGPRGRVYAVDIDPAAIEAVQRRASAEKRTQVVTTLGSESDPRLPAGSVDVVLLANTYHELGETEGLMRALVRILKPGGLLAIIDAGALPGEPPASYRLHHRIPSQVVQDEVVRSGFRYVRSELGFINPEAGWYSYSFFLIFQRP